MNEDELLRGALVGIEDSQHGSGQATAPSTATDIISSGAPSITAGLWEFDITINLSGTAETLLRNLNLRVGTTAVFSNLPTVPGTVPVKLVKRITNADIATAGGSGNPAAAALNFRTNAAPTAGAVYTVSVRAIKRGG